MYIIYIYTYTYYIYIYPLVVVIFWLGCWLGWFGWIVRWDAAAAVLLLHVFVASVFWNFWDMQNLCNIPRPDGTSTF